MTDEMKIEKEFWQNAAASWGKRDERYFAAGTAKQPGNSQTISEHKKKTDMNNPEIPTEEEFILFDDFSEKDMDEMLSSFGL